MLLLLANVDDRPVGLLNGRLLRDASIFRESVLTIDNMYVVPEKRRSGIGQRLLAAAADWGRSEGASEIRLSVVAGNSIAEHFYEGEGFTIRARVLTRPMGE